MRIIEGSETTSKDVRVSSALWRRGCSSSFPASALPPYPNDFVVHWPASTGRDEGESREERLPTDGPNTERQ